MTHFLTVGRTGTTFQVVAQQRTDTYTFRSADGTFWGGVVKSGSPILSNASGSCVDTTPCPLIFSLYRQWN